MIGCLHQGHSKCVAAICWSLEFDSQNCQLEEKKDGYCNVSDLPGHFQHLFHFFQFGDLWKLPFGGMRHPDQRADVGV